MFSLSVVYFGQRRPDAEPGPGPGAYDPAGSAFGYQVFIKIIYKNVQENCLEMLHIIDNLYANFNVINN